MHGTTRVLTNIISKQTQNTVKKKLKQDRKEMPTNAEEAMKNEDPFLTAGGDINSMEITVMVSQKSILQLPCNPAV